MITENSKSNKRKLNAAEGGDFCGSSEATRAEDPGLSAAKEAAEAVPAKSVRLERNDRRTYEFLDSPKKTSR
ncbi:hypothetical protein [Planococcus shenhongbingii]|uniref:YfhD family protein n=1 Tax=Planococcus shenhongbingii TaxID=3058398 RepID=A0ABT8N9E6_9BACL|nr:hypothetical protein [Planococcus sp. N017]MDN7244503.1 hypothetical protein [Planococcus sp. N017]